MQLIDEINDLAGLASYRQAWASLLAETPGASFFQSLPWLEVYWKHFGQGQKLRVLVVLELDRPVGIVPLVVRTEPTKAGRIRFLTYPLDYWGSYYGPIGPEPQKALQAALAHLRASRRDWDVLELRWVGHADDDGTFTARAMEAERLSACHTVFDQTAIIRLDGTWEQYLASRAHKWRTNYRRWQRRLGELGQVTYLRYRPGGEAAGEDDPRWDLYEACLALAKKSWQGSSPDGTTLSHDSIRPFLTDVHEAAARMGALDLNLLLLDDRPIAFAYNYYYRGYVYGLRVGYDAEAGRYGAGNVLYGRTIEDCFRRGDRIYDMGPGSLECKRHFQSEIRPIGRYSHFPSLALRAQLLRLKRQFDHWTQEENPSPLSLTASD
jgi:CelD/BcsL family acetyltransferase involved in cellulose biosynthesis